MISSLTCQLVEQSVDIINEVRALYSIRKVLTLKEHLSLLSSVSQYFKRSFVVIDAIDECSDINLQGQNNEGLLFALREMQSFVKLLVTSRPDSSVRHFEGCARINMVSSDADIKVYLEDEVSRDPKFGASGGKDTTLGAVVVNSISENCGSMYGDMLSSASVNVADDKLLAGFFSRNYSLITF
jgi:hypothetical protein